MRSSISLGVVDLGMTYLLVSVGLVAFVLVLGIARSRQIRPSPDFLELPLQSGEIRASGFDRHGENVEIGPVSLEHARTLVNDRLAFVETTTGTDENAEHSGVMFYRSDNDWIGLYARRSNEIDLDVSLGLKRAFGHRLIPVNRSAADHWLSLFFQSPRAFASALAAYSQSKESR